MVVNDDAGFLVKRGDLKSIVGTPPGASSLLQGEGAYAERRGTSR
jgi:hypothetical protein